MIEKYMIIEAPSKEVMVYNVNTLMEEGWEPWGGISAIVFSVPLSMDLGSVTGITFFQAMVKEGV